MICEKTNTQLLLGGLEESARPRRNKTPAGSMERKEEDRRRCREKMRRLRANWKKDPKKNAAYLQRQMDYNKSRNRKTTAELSPEQREKRRLVWGRYKAKHPERIRAACRKSHWKRKNQRTPEQVEEQRLKDFAYHKAYRAKNRQRKKEYNHRPEVVVMTRRARKSLYQRKYAKPRTPMTPEQRKESARKSWSKYRIKRMANPANRIMLNIRNRISSAVRGTLKAARSQELLGCTSEEFRAHLEKQFQPGMTWETYGRFGWHVDHIRPCDSFDFNKPEDQKACFHFSNCQPLWWRDNVVKKNKHYHPVILLPAA